MWGHIAAASEGQITQAKALPETTEVDDPPTQPNHEA